MCCTEGCRGVLASTDRYSTTLEPDGCAAAQIVHRDVKGLNILLKETSGYFKACICDFGAQSNANSRKAAAV